MIVLTENSTYEIRLAEHRYRRTTGPAGRGPASTDAWKHFEMLGEVEVGEPLRIYTDVAPVPTRGAAVEQALHRLRLVTTSPVLEVVEPGPESGPAS